MLRQLTSLLVPSSLTPTASQPDPTVCAAVVRPLREVFIWFPPLSFVLDQSRLLPRRNKWSLPSVFPSVVSQNSQAGALLLLQQGQPSIVSVVLMEIQITFQTGPLTAFLAFHCVFLICTERIYQRSIRTSNGPVCFVYSTWLWWKLHWGKYQYLVPPQDQLIRSYITLIYLERYQENQSTFSEKISLSC